MEPTIEQKPMTAHHETDNKLGEEEEVVTREFDPAFVKKTMRKVCGSLSGPSRGC